MRMGGLMALSEVTKGGWKRREDEEQDSLAGNRWFGGIISGNSRLRAGGDNTGNSAADGDELANSGDNANDSNGDFVGPGCSNNGASATGGGEQRYGADNPDENGRHENNQDD